MSVRACAVQFDPRLGAVRENEDRLCAEVHAAAAEGAQLVVFPEAAMTGYVFDSLRDAREAAVSRDDPELASVARAARESDVWVVCPTLERDGDRLYNTAFLLAPHGVVGRYRKTHTLCLGMDRFTWPGVDGFPVFDTPLGRIGLHICYDSSFPEAARALKLGGADLLVLATNWPRLHLKQAVVQVRAYENHAFYLAVNRVGIEAGVRFEGGSCAADPEGALLLAAGREAGRFHLGMDLSRARDSREVIRAGEYELDLLADRAPSAYGRLTEPIPDQGRTGSRQRE